MKELMNEDDVTCALFRIAHQIIERNKNPNDICLVGIWTRGVPIAQRLAYNIKKISMAEIPVGKLDITNFRDDLVNTQNQKKDKTEILFSIVGKTVILVDDVFFTGRTARAALDALISHGRPAQVQYAALVDRGHIEFPIKATFIGKNIPSSLSEEVIVHLKELDGETNVTIQ
ncbi:MAG: bifunctional pyr operon transcriptional regulator/uracil phosphoribosyltransferase PyrR [Bacillota bacterium]|nr:bifunctional pyr operon transcriptional regulator/uracil phosphoribosyltransferase PyrR [Bacillota bacterium]